jgi:hypothetical protein
MDVQHDEDRHQQTNSLLTRKMRARPTQPKRSRKRDIEESNLRIASQQQCTDGLFKSSSLGRQLFSILLLGELVGDFVIGNVGFVQRAEV